MLRVKKRFLTEVEIGLFVMFFILSFSYLGMSYLSKKVIVKNKTR